MSWKTSALAVEGATAALALVGAGASAHTDHWIVAVALFVLGCLGCFRIILQLEDGPAD
jgi:TRAP-type C4-dicarboxylate transport system permease small subunit